MKLLYFLRHGEAAALSAYIPSDEARPLTARGVSQIAQLSSFFLEKVALPNLLLVSPARRTQETADILLDTWPIEKQPHRETVDWLYQITPADLLTQLQLIAKRFEVVALCAHNPFLSHLAAQLADLEDFHLSPGGFFGMRFDMENWSALPDTKAEVYLDLHEGLG